MEAHQRPNIPAYGEEGWFDWALRAINLERIRRANAQPPQPQVPAPVNDVANPIVGMLEIPPLQANEAYLPNPIAPGTFMHTVAGVRTYNLHDEVEKAVNYLYCKTLGKTVDDKYQAYCTALLNSFFDECKLTDYTTRRQIFELAIARHMDDRMRPSFVYTQDNLGRLKALNKNIKGTIFKRCWYMPWIVEEENLNDSLNFNPILSAQPSTKWYHWIVPSIAAGAIGLTAVYFMRRQSQNPMDTIIIPNPVKQLMQPIETAINQEVSKNMSHIISKTFTDTLRNSLSTQESSLRRIIADQCSRSANSVFTWLSWKS